MASHVDDDNKNTVCEACLCDEIPLNIYNSCEPKYYITLYIQYLLNTII